MPDDVDVLSAVTLLLVVFRPVDRDAMLLVLLDSELDSAATLELVVERPLDSDTKPVETVPESAVKVLLVVERPVERDATPLCTELIAVDADVLRLETVLLVADRPVDSELASVDS
jgi:hypothetical protein